MNESREPNSRLIEIKNLEVSYTTGSYVKKAVNDVSFDIFKGDLTVIMGSSGCGKTSLLNAIGGMLTPSAGSIIYRNTDIAAMNRSQLSRYRRNSVGFIFQHYNLIPNLTAKENVDTAIAIVKNPIPALDSLEMVGLREKAGKYPGQMSGGEQQRVCIARAISKNCELILCDEPTGALDTENAMQIIRILDFLAHKQGTAVVLITHNPAFSGIAEHYIEMSNGKIIKNLYNDNPASIDSIVLK